MKLQPTPSTFAQRTLASMRRLVVVASICMAPFGWAQTDEALPAEPAPDKEPIAKQCEWACERWTKVCNVDPRGVYKCRRTCAKFGEVCE
jgi:hypothetical protein